MQNIISLKTITRSRTIFISLSSVNSYSKSFALNSCTFSIFPALEIKKLVPVGKIFWPFRHNSACMVNSFLLSLETPVMINILYEMIKILHEKMLTLSWRRSLSNQWTGFYMITASFMKELKYNIFILIPYRYIRDK